jgi:DNA-binding IclR family transcriptional regulator
MTSAVNDQPVGRTDMVGKALRVIQAIGAGPLDGRTLTELARETGFPLSTVHRLVATLAREGYVECDEQSKRYRIGLTIFALAQRVSEARGYDGVALPILRQLAAQTRESTLMSVLDGPNQLYVHHIHGPRQINVIGEPGTRGPLHCTAMGKVLVAYAPRAQSAELVATLELPKLGPNTITDRDAFAAEIARVHARGYAIADQEHEEGIGAVGVPVLRADGTAIASISVAGPSFRLSPDDLTAMVPALTTAARELALKLPAR